MTRSAWLRVAMVATLLPYASAHARSMGIMGQYAAGCGAPSCHSTSESTTAQITLSAPAMIPPRGSANVTVSISDPSVPLTGINQGGFDLKTDGGTFTASAGTQNFSDIEVGHNMAGNNQRSWTIPWAAGAPSLCEFTLQAAANAVNGDGAPGTEDHWRRASASIRVDARGDTKAPVATIVDPAPGNAYVNDSSMGYPLAVPIVVGTITIEVSASDDIGIDRVEIYDTDAAGGPTLLGKATYDPASKRFGLFWDAGADTPGLHTLTARAIDCGGKSVESQGQAFVL